MKVFFAIVVLSSFCYHTSFAQEANDVRWFETIFQASHRIPTEKEIEKKQNDKLIAIENNDPEKEIRVLMELGAIHLTKSKSREEALEYFIQALALEDSLRLDHEKVFTLLAIARVFEEVFEFERSLEYADQTRELNETDKDHNVLMLILKKNARIHTKNGDTETAIEKYQEILSYAEKC